MMMLTETERTKMREEFGIRFLGAMVGGLEDAAFEGYFKAGQPGTIGKFPYISIHDKLPPADDLIVGGLAIPAWVIGALMEEDGKKRGDIKAKELGRNVKMFGEGDVIYALNMLVHHTVLRLPEPKWMPPEKRVVGSRRTPGAGGPPRRSDVGHKIYKL